MQIRPRRTSGDVVPAAGQAGPPPAGGGRGAGSSTADRHMGEEESSNPDGRTDVGRLPGAPPSTRLTGRRARATFPSVTSHSVLFRLPCVSSDEALFQNAATDATVRGSHPRFRRQSRVLRAASSAFGAGGSACHVNADVGTVAGGGRHRWPSGHSSEGCSARGPGTSRDPLPFCESGARSQVTARATALALGGRYE